MRILLVFLLFVAPVAAQTPPSSADIERRVESILSQMTMEEKIDMLGGFNLFLIRGIPRLKVPVLATTDGPFGVRSPIRANIMLGGIGLAATWNPELAERVGVELGRDARARGVHFHLAPGVNIYRSPLNGRNFEYLGEDPFLAARMAVGYIRGVQSQGVSSTVKHLLGNNSEYLRHTTDSVIDDRALREIYLPAFEAAVREANVGAIMGSYNLYNGEHMSQKRSINVDLVRGEWGFQGVLMSDWDATYDALGAANGGLDLEMPSGAFMNKTNLLPLIQQGKVSPATIDEKVRRLLRTAARFGWLDRDQRDPSIPHFNKKGAAVALETAREAMVLLKNDNGLLPLDKQKTKSIAIIGPNAYPAVPLGGGSVTVPTYRTISFLEGLSNYLATDADVHYTRGIGNLKQVVNRTRLLTAKTGGKSGVNVEVFENEALSGEPSSKRVDETVTLGSSIDIADLATGAIELDWTTLALPRKLSVRWTGFYVPQKAGAHEIIVQQGGFVNNGYRLYIDGKLIDDSWSLTKAEVVGRTVELDESPHEIKLEYRAKTGLGSPYIRMGIARKGEWVEKAAEEMARKADAVILAVGFDATSEGENWDRTFGLPPGQDELIEKISALNKNTIVVLTSGGAVDMTRWIDRVPAIVEVWYPGQEGGTALAELVFGQINPSGRLPATFERRAEDNPTFANYYPEPGTNRAVYKEGVFVGYRGYEKNGTKPLFAFGHGISYTTFKYGNLAIKRLDGNDLRYEVAFDVENTGKRAGAEVAQVYVGDAHAKVPRPAKELKGFAKVNLAPGEKKRVTVTLDERSFSYYDVEAKSWRYDAGDFDILVGRSSQEIELRGKATLARR